MANTTLVRRANALALHRRFLEQSVASGLPAKGLDQLFAAKLGISPSMWSQIKGSRPIGDTLARQIEKHCGQASGWLDQEREQVAPDPAEERFLALARAAWRAANARGKRELRRRFEADTVGALPQPAHCTQSVPDKETAPASQAGAARRESRRLSS